MGKKYYVIGYKLILHILTQNNVQLIFKLSLFITAVKEMLLVTWKVCWLYKRILKFQPIFKHKTHLL